MTVDELIEKLQLLNVGNVEVHTAYYEDLSDALPISEVTYLRDSKGERVVFNTRGADCYEFCDSNNTVLTDDDEEGGLWDDFPPVGFSKVVSQRSE